MTKYSIEITANAKANLRHYYARAAERAPATAAKWLSRFEKTLIQTLSTQADILPLAPESMHVEEDIRRMLFGKRNADTYRVLYAIRRSTVYVLHIRRALMDTASPEELYG